jgi:uncharacterized protein YebE (UPF0316 family)
MLTLDPAVLPIVIFVLRVMNNAIGTVRVIVMTGGGRRALGFGLASMESLLFAYTAGMVLTNLENFPNLVAYVLGFAAGGYVGVAIERRYLDIYEVINITATVEKAHQIAVALRKANYGVTEEHGTGAMGSVATLRIVTHQRDVPEVIRITRSIKSDAFITVEQSRLVQNGWLHTYHQHHQR